ncbi:hypothetical protein H0H92_004775 [Tricholoma furcatifolium]|nr:hypothetical protein H0H92_004775 [Tricholoma furcatifolium]
MAIPVGIIQHVAQVTRICQLVPSIIVLYDHIITFDMEVELVWNRYFGTIVLFTTAIRKVYSSLHQHQMSCTFLAPYAFEMGINISPVVRNHLFILQGWTTAILLWAVQSIMLCRTFAIFRQNKVVMTVCITCFVAQIAAMSAILAATQQALERNHSSLTVSMRAESPFIFLAHKFSAPGVFICAPRKISRIYRGVWIPPIIFDIANLLLSMTAFFRRSPQLRGVIVIENPMWKVLRDDTLKYYIVVLAISFANATVWFVLPPEWLKLLQGFFTAAVCVMGGRLVLSFRMAYYRSSPNDSDEFGNEDIIIQRVAFSQPSDGLIPLQEMNHRGSREHRRQSSERFEVPQAPTTLDKIIGIT